VILMYVFIIITLAELTSRAITRTRHGGGQSMDGSTVTAKVNISLICLVSPTLCELKLATSKAPINLLRLNNSKNKLSSESDCLYFVGMVSIENSLTIRRSW